MGCEFCEIIWHSEEHYRNQFSSHWDEEKVIVMEGDEPYLYIPCEDFFILVQSCKLIIVPNVEENCK